MAPAEYQNTFSNSLNYGLQVGHNTGNIETHHHYAADDPLTLLVYSKNARFNSKYRYRAQVCLKNTRTDLLRDIYNWVDGEDERHIFWLNGLAGTGKSTIAQTVAKHYYDLNPKRLAASFFFARGGGDASHAGLFATSIAVQLASDVPVLRDAVRKAVTECVDITSRSLTDQWHPLVLQPFSSLKATHSPSSYLIVIDALDECNSENDIQTILLLLSEARQFTQSRLRFLLTSRPDTAIRHGFDAVATIERWDTVLHKIDPAVVNQDIAFYLNHELTEIGQKQYLGPYWPTQWQVQQLVSRSSGLFIWAATACRFIREGRNHANERLSKVLKTQTRDIAPEKELDAVYTMVLTSSVPENLSEEEKGISYGLLNYTLGSVVALFTPLSIPALHLLLDIPLNEITRTVNDLHSILHIPLEESDELQLHHPSFRDYLVNPSRCGLESLQINEKGAHRKLLLSCLLLMSRNLKENICDLDYANPGILLAEVEEKHIQQLIHPSLRYACLYWVQHLQRSGEMIYDKHPVDDFMRQHLLAWLEALSWMGRAAESIRAVTCLLSIASTNTCPLFYQYIQDVKHFISHSYPIVERAPLQLYLSALIFTPQSSHVRNHFQQRVFRWMRTLPVMKKNWSSSLQLEGHTDSVNAIAFSPDGTMLASASKDRTVRLWDTATGSARQTLEGRSLNSYISNYSVNAIAFSPDGTMLASASNDRTVRLWDTATGSARQILMGHTDSVNAIAFSPDGTMLASGDRIVRLWDTATGSARQTLEGQPLEGYIYPVNAIAFSPDGTMLASVSNDRTVRLWDIATGRTRQTLTDRTFKGDTYRVSVIAFSPDGTMLALTFGDGTVWLWDTAIGSARQAFAGQTVEGYIYAVELIVFSPDGTILASASGDGTVWLWDTATGSVHQTLKGHIYPVNAIAFSPDGTMLASASSDRTVRLWDTATGSTRQTLKGYTYSVNAIAFSPDGTMLALASDDRTVRLWDIAAGSARQTLEGQTLDGHTYPVNTIAFSPDGTMLASASSDGIVRLWDTATGSARQTLKGHTHRVNAIVFSPDGTILASASDDKTVRLWDTATGRARQTLKGHIYPVNVITFSLDGTMLASASSDTVQLWDIATRRARQRLKGQTLKGSTYPVNAITFSPDGTILASASGDGTVWLWDTATGSARQILKGHTGRMNAITFSPDGTMLASASNDRTVRLWDTATGSTHQILEGHTYWVTAIAFSPDGTMLASASNDRTVRLWDLATGRARQILEDNIDGVNAVAFSPDGKAVTTDRRRINLNSDGIISRSPLQHSAPAPALAIENPWIACNGYHVLWLPPSYRSNVSALYATKVAIGCFSGQVLIFELNAF